MENCLAKSRIYKMRPYYGQSSRENATPSSGTSPLASYEEVPPPPVRFKPQAEDIDEALADAKESLELCKSNVTKMQPLTPRGVLLGILGGGVPPGYPNPDPIYFRPQNVIFHTRFQTWPPRNYVIIT